MATVSDAAVVDRGLAANVDGEMPSVDDVRVMAGLPDNSTAYDAAMEAAVAAPNDPELPVGVLRRIPR